MSEEYASTQSSETLPTMPLVEHMRELRSRCLKAVLALLIASIASWFAAPAILQWLVDPLASHWGNDEARRLIFTELTEAFVTYLKISWYGGLALSMPVWLYQLYAFLAPALYKHERRYALTLISFSPICFAIGASLAFFAVFPLAWQFMLGFEIPQAGPDQVPIMLEAKISSYVSLSLTIMLAFGLAFQLPIITLMLVHLGIISHDMLASKRPWVFVGLLALAAFVTPPDIISQVALALPLYLLFELSMLLARKAPKT